MMICHRNGTEILFGADYFLQFYISRNKLEFLYSLMAFVDVVTLFPILVFNLVPPGSSFGGGTMWYLYVNVWYWPPLLLAGTLWVKIEVIM